MNSFCKKLILFLTFILFSFFMFAQAGDVTTINIVNARQTTYTKDKDTDNDLINLDGSVELSVKKGDTVSEIKADKITYDRQSEMLYAEGNVEIITKTGSSGGEKTTASALLMNTATLEGVFDDGRVVQTQSDAINLPSGSTLVVFSDVFGKSESNVIAFKNSSLTFCDAEDPHWRIDASRTWLLPGGEFAFFNALLYVGNVPVLYFPAFYYPKDELIFNPVFGYAKRTGVSVQTTTYLLGRKPLDSSNSSSSSDSTAEESLMALYNFMRPGSLKEQVREGLVLHNLDKDYTGDTSKYIKLMLDWYSNLGVMIGVDGKLAPQPKYISNLSFNTHLGISNTIFVDSLGNYVPYSPTTGKSYHDSSTFLGVTLPFRYSGNLQFGLSKPFKLTLSLPIYSDPFFSNDYLNSRSESMDWISYFLNSNNSSDNSTTISEVSSFSWTVTSSYSFKIPDAIKKYVSTMSFSTNSSVAFSTKTANLSDFDTSKYEKAWITYTPDRKFYYPSQITPGTVNMSISGTIFQWPKSSSSSKKAPTYTVALNVPDELKSDSQIQKEKDEKERLALEQAEKEARKAAEEAAKAAGEEFVPEEEIIVEKETVIAVAEEVQEAQEFIEPTFPTLEHSTSAKSLNQGLNYKLTYSITPNLTTQVAYSSTPLNKSEDFKWKNIRSFMYTAKIPTSLNSNLSYGGSFVSLTNKVSFDPVFQDHPYVLTYDSTQGEKDNGGYNKAAANSLRLADYKAEVRNVTNTNSFTFKPFINSPVFSDTNLSWNSTIKLYRREFIGDADNPEWESHGLDLEDDNCVTVNSVNLTLGANELSNKLRQSVTFSAVLPPLLRKYSATMNLSFPNVSFSLGTGFEEVSHEILEDQDKWTKNPLQQSLSVSLLNSKLKLSESYNYNIQDKHHDSLKLSASWTSLSLSYVMSYTTGYTLDMAEGWIANSEKQFLPYSLSFSFNPSSKTLYKWSNRIVMSAGLSTSIVADFLRPTNTYFTFTPNLSFKINDFFTLTFSSSSRNSILYWYFHEGPYDEGFFAWSILKDLMNSFRFDRDDLRRQSGFKMKSLNMTMSHELHDWSFNMTASVTPKIVTKAGKKEYDVTPKITIGIVWNPMSSIKSNLVYEYNDSEEKGIWSLEQ